MKFSISQDRFDRIDLGFFKAIVLFAISWYSNKIINFIFLGFENVDKKANLSKFEDNRTKIAEVKAE